MMKSDNSIASILRFLILLVMIMIGNTPAIKALHLIGGELTYECQSNDNYLIKLKIFRDCSCTAPNCAGFDEPAFVFIYDNFGNLVSQLSMVFPGSTPIPAFINNPCLAFPPDICVEEASYATLINLPPISGGYHIVHQRCCRNSSILNIAAPNTFGSTYYAHIPDPGIVLCNSSPFFNNFPPVALCVGDTLSFDHSATDIDGDSLVYSLCTPYSGASQTTPQPGLGFTSAPPPPYGFVNYINPYSGTAPFNGSPPMAIHPQTGLLTGSPTTPGQFVVGVCVKEYRNGFLLSENKRDLQFNVLQCDDVTPASTPAFVLECDDFTVNFINNTAGATSYAWDFGDGATSTAFTPAHLYSDTGIYSATLIANPGWPCADTALMAINVFPGMTAIYDYVTHCADTDITFTDLSISTNGLITDWIWSFGDGASTTDQNTSHNYAQGGLYDVQLTTINDKGCVDVLVQPVYVYLEPEPTILFNAPCEKTEMTFDDGTQLDSGYVATWDWDIAGLATDSVSSTSFTFDSSGFYDITLSVVTDHGCDGIATQTIFIKPIPSSDAGLDTAICAGEMISIGGSLTSGYAYDWDPPTGLNSPSVASPTLVLSNDSNVLVMHTYTVTTSLNGCSSSDTVDIGVFPSINPSLPVQEEQCWPNNRFFFEADGVFSPNAILTWDFGDGNVLTGSDTVSHHYDTLGNSDTVRSFTVTLTVEDNGCTEVTSVEVQVFLVPVATFLPVSQVGCQPFSVDFTAVSSNPAIADSQLTFIWNFDDAASGALNIDTGQFSSHIYNLNGTYQPTLTITLGGCSKFEEMTQSLTVSVLPMPKAGLLIDPPVASVYDPIVNIIDMSEGADSCWLMVEDGTWMNVCGYVQNFYDPNASFDDTVTHYITQVVKNGFGCADTFRVAIDVLPAFIFFAPNSFTPNGDGVNDLFRGRGFGIKDFEMLVYNRWGDLIWYTEDRFEGWDGIANVGKREAQQGVFVYLVNIVDIFDVPHEVVGKVVIIR